METWGRNRSLGVSAIRTVTYSCYLSPAFKKDILRASLTKDLKM
jgi:hypothetical protein